MYQYQTANIDAQRSSWGEGVFKGSILLLALAILLTCAAEVLVNEEVQGRLASLSLPELLALIFTADLASSPM